MKKTIILEGLSCANCANKIENEVNKIDDVEAVVNFSMQSLTLEIDSKNIKDEQIEDKLTLIMSNVKSIVKKIEPDVKISEKSTKNAVSDFTSNTKQDKHSENEGDNIKFEVMRLIIGGIIFALTVGFDFTKNIELVLYVVSYMVVGGPVLKKAIYGIFQGEMFNEFFLMAIATIGAFLIGEYPEAVAVMLFYLVGELFQDMAVDHSRKSISSLMNIKPEYANLKINDEIKKVSPEEVKIGDVILVKPGEKIPLDGIVIEGSSMVDTAALTGESLPRELEKDSMALSGFINLNSVLVIKVLKNFEDSTVSKILDLVQNASNKKAETEKFITKFARYYTPVVVFSSMALAIIPPMLIPDATFSEWIYRALVFLVVSCPCALVISIPLGFFGGIGGASKKGVLIKGSNYLEALYNATTVVFDKTGTLTKGEFSVHEVKVFNGFTEDELMFYAMIAESNSNHPIAKGVVDYCNKKLENNLNENMSFTYEEIAGFGVKAFYKDKEILAGNHRLMTDNKIESFNDEIATTTVHIAVDNIYAGYFSITDELKSDAIDAINKLKKIGIKRIVMLTGDRKEVADVVAKKLGITEVYSGLLPIDKVEKLEEIENSKDKSEKIIFVGDGINDAPVLKRADIGIAMGGLGSDAAIEAADIVLMKDEPSSIVTAIKVAKKTRDIVMQNIIFALGIKAIFLGLGAFGVASMWEAVFADVGVAIIAILNAMRVMKLKI